MDLKILQHEFNNIIYLVQVNSEAMEQKQPSTRGTPDVFVPPTLSLLM